MLKELFQKQQSHLEYFFSKIDVSQCEALFSKLKSCPGIIFFTGIGKSGYVAQKIAATMMSTGSRSFYLSATEALHGDLGIVSSLDVFIIFSKSGETEELLRLLPPIRNKGAFIVAITSNPQSRLDKGADFSLELPCQSELCPFDLAPTTSTEIQLLFGDVLAIALMQEKGFALETFAQNHPAGRIGKRSNLRVKDLMLDKTLTPLCFAGDKLEDVLLDFSNKRCGCLVVIDEDKKLKGIFTDGDLRRALQAKGENVLKETLGNLMSSTPKAIDAKELAWNALKLMEADQKHPVMVLPVLEEEKVIGLIKMHDIIQAGL